MTSLRGRETVFRRHKDADARMESASRLVHLLLEAEDLYPAHRKQFIKLALWKVTEAEGGKYNTRYRSEGSLRRNVRLQHEHVYERAKMADELMAQPDRMEEILAMVVGCTVSKDEHESLGRISRERPELSGWDRYAAAGIKVLDTLPHQYQDEPGKTNTASAKPGSCPELTALGAP